ncbi:hypothetical protein [Microbacterium sp. cx-59]|uniref:hypothetical protein n=1 Tax=Microbacterium sp. cx-59 TaxID=2891207 RepID=UPI001E3246C5|nr:hypothetical protein [Microbacterium sp. cx-59]MCC4906960.1 hypothetical protein [Microbacterium sp. cx-59]
MNRYAAAGIAQDAQRGRRVLVVSPDGRGTRTALDAIAARTPGAMVRRAKGSETVHVEGAGAVYFTTPRSDRGRGMSVDVVYLDDVTETPELRADLVPCLATSTVGELIR